MNEYFDRIYYDHERITEADRAVLSENDADEGCILVVPQSGNGKISVHKDAEAFIASGGSAVKILSVSGVGSSALGAAALARNIADVMDAPVAAVVSGRGVFDTVSEGLGGWFIFRPANFLRSYADYMRHTSDAALYEVSYDWLSLATIKTPDVLELIKLFSSEALKFDLVVGHSKGNLVIAEALFARDGYPAVPTDTAIVTLSAVIYMPGRFTNVIDVMGKDDSLGKWNSMWWLEPDIVIPGAGHKTNPQDEDHLSVHEVFARIKQDFDVTIG